MSSFFVPEHGSAPLWPEGRGEGAVQGRLVAQGLHLPLVVQARLSLARPPLLLAADAGQLHLLGAELLLLLGEALHAELHLVQHVDRRDLGLKIGELLFYN